MTFKFLNRTITAKDLNENPWLKYLFLAEKNQFNVEKVDSVENVTENITLKYVEKTLELAQFSKLKGKYKKALLLTLQWSEVAKGGSEKIRKEWEKNGYCLDIHNEASAEIYLNESNNDLWTTKVVYALIKTHGLLGQFIRGEVLFSEHEPLISLLNTGVISSEDLSKILQELNYCVIVAATSNTLYNKIKSQINVFIHKLCFNRSLSCDLGKCGRLQRMFPTAFQDVKKLTKEEKKLYTNVLSYHDIWYPEIALDSFTRTEINTIFHLISLEDRRKIKHISFYPLSKTLFYDYEGKREVNIYKKRIIELSLKEIQEGLETSKHVKFVCEKQGNTLFFDVKFTKACESLIQFCIDAERSGIMDYQKNIVIIFDLFGFRKDVFDRLNNEKKYLDTMNETKHSRKEELLNYVTGNTIVDVGSGGGVLLDKLEKLYPNKRIIGTDISANVIDSLNKKIKTEKHSYTVMNHNFVEKPLDFKVDTIIFSSILHEVFSYTEFKGEKFNIESVKIALKNAYESLNEGGCILIRDGILTNNNDVKSLVLKTQEGIDFCKNFIRDFKGLNDRLCIPCLNKNILTGDINFLREFLYTYTWGLDSYSCEVNEQFGYFTLRAYNEFLTSLGLKILVSDEYLEEGYRTHLEPLVTLENFDFKDIPSNCILVAKKDTL